MLSTFRGSPGFTRAFVLHSKARADPVLGRPGPATATRDDTTAVGWHVRGQVNAGELGLLRPEQKGQPSEESLTGVLLQYTGTGSGSWKESWRWRSDAAPTPRKRPKRGVYGRTLERCKRQRFRRGWSAPETL